MNEKCLFCYLPLKNDELDFHLHCSKLFFGTETPPLLDFTLDEIEALALKVLGKQNSLTGVQPKLSIELSKEKRGRSRLTIVGLWGNYIFKPPFNRFPGMPENEDLTMHLASLFGIKTAQHSLIRMKSGEPGYITKRFDRHNSVKFHVEDMAQITEVLTERKYSGSMEKIGKSILKYSDFAGNDVIRFFELTLFCFVTGNSDMHLKNFSLLRNSDVETEFSPAYDLLSAKLLMPQDNDELALTLNGKKSNLRKKDFEKFADGLGIVEKVRENTFLKLFNSQKTFEEFIDLSFLKAEMKDGYKSLISDRLTRLQ